MRPTPNGGSAYDVALRSASPLRTISAPMRAIAQAGKPVNGSSAGWLACVATALFTCFGGLVGAFGLVGGVEAPAVAPVVAGVEGVDVDGGSDVVGGLDVVVGVLFVVLVVFVVVVVGVLVLTVVVVVVDVLVGVDELVVGVDACWQ
jgi:hypothetical protein